MSTRDAMLSKLRKALETGGPPAAPAAAPRLPVTVIDAAANRAELRSRFVAELARVRGVVYAVPDETSARATLRTILQEKKARRLAAWDDVPLAGWEALLSELAIERLADDRAAVATADVGLTGCDAVIAATGTLALEGGPGRSRLASLLPPIHVVIARESQLVPTLEDYLSAKKAGGLDAFQCGSAITLVTGPSRTADIEMQIVFGAHGPIELHVILIAA